MIVAIGLDVDDTLVHLLEQARDAGVPVKTVNLRALVDGSWRMEVPAKGPAQLVIGGAKVELQPDDAYYCRMIDLASSTPGTAAAKRWQAMLGAFRAWLETVPGRVANRGNGGNHNSSKPLHEAILTGLGFAVPESITSCDVDELRRFVRAGPTISKTVCGTRAETTTVTEADFENFVPESGPVHLQRWVNGADARIHVTGDQMVAQWVSTEGVDYRKSGMKQLEVFEPPAPIRDRLVEGSAKVGLAFSGWDFKIDESGNYWCLEVNPMPGYSSYDHRCKGAISRQLFSYLGSKP